MAEEKANSISGSLWSGNVTDDTSLTFPPDSWFNSSLPSCIRDGLRLAYRVHGINPSTMYLQYSATKISNIGSWVRSEAYEALITAIILAAQEKNKDEELEKITICPLLPGYGTLVREANTILNPVYSPQTTGQPSTSGNALENYVSGGIGPLKQETQDVDAFQKALSGRQDAMDRYRQAAE